MIDIKNNGGVICMHKEKENLYNILKIVVYFAHHSSRKLYKTKLNKLLFYTQFLYYKLYKKRLLADDFICDYYGPVLDDLDQYLQLFSEIGVINIENTQFGNTIESEKLIPLSEYSENELFVLKRVSDQFDSFTSRDISEYSHKEALWEECDYKEVIRLEEADKLNEF